MHVLAGVLGAALILIILGDAFETIILPRRVTRRFRLTRLFIRGAWKFWGSLLRGGRSKRRDRYLSYFGPLAMIFLIVMWAVGLMVGFAALAWAMGSPLGFAMDLYMSGTTISTLGPGDVTPKTPGAHVLTVLEAGTGFAFLAIVVGYLPVLYQAFSRREVHIALLDARAGSPSTAAELLRRVGNARSFGSLDDFLLQWEHWAAELLESHISYPILSYFRSQHDNQSWLASLSTIMDTCAVVISGVDDLNPWQAQLTFAMSRHAAVDIAQILNTPPRPPSPERLCEADLARLLNTMEAAGLAPRRDEGFVHRLAELRRMYEPYVFSLAQYLRVTVPGWVRDADTVDNWRTSAWERRSTGLPRSIFDGGDDEHS